MDRRMLIGGLGVLVAVGVGIVLYQRAQPEIVYRSVSELIADLERNGVDCEGGEVSGADQTEQVGAEFGFCYISETGQENQRTSVTIHVYHETDLIESHVERHLASRGDTPNNFTVLVRDENWIVEGYSKERIRLVQEAIGGAVE